MIKNTSTAMNVLFFFWGKKYVFIYSNRWCEMNMVVVFNHVLMMKDRLASLLKSNLFFSLQDLLPPQERQVSSRRWRKWWVILHFTSGLFFALSHLTLQWLLFEMCCLFHYILNVYSKTQGCNRRLWAFWICRYVQCKTLLVLCLFATCWSCN